MLDLESGLKKFLEDKIEPRLQRKRIKNAKNIVGKSVAKKLEEDLVKRFLMGSYKRHTLIRKSSDASKYDVDYMFVLDDTFKPESMLDKIEEIAAELVKEINDIKKYRRQKVSIGLWYDDDFSIDMVPSVGTSDGNYIIYDSHNQQEIRTNPKKHNKIVSELNHKNKELLVPLIKLIKRWKQENADEILKSFHLEMLTVEVFRQKDLTNLLKGLSKFFEEAYKHIEDEKELTDPIGGHDISGYLDDKDNPQRKNAIKELLKAKNAVEDAINHEQKEEYDLARRAMGRIFSYFATSHDKKLAKTILPSLASAPKPWANSNK